MHFKAVKRLRTQGAFIILATLVASQAAAQMAPISPTAAPVSESGAQAIFEPVRQAIARQDYNAARTALDAIRQQNPNLPEIALYESLIERRQTQGQTIGAQSPLRTPRAGVTPAPTPVPTATPVPTPTPAPAPVATPAASTVDKAKAQFEDLKDNPMALYGAIAAAVLILLGIIAMIMKGRRRRAAEASAPSSFAHTEDYSGVDGELTAPGAEPLPGITPAPLSTDYGFGTPSMSAYGTETEAPMGGAEPLAGGSALGGAMGAGMGSFTVPTFGIEEEEEAPPAPKPTYRPEPKPEDEGPVNLFGDEPPAPVAAPAAEELPEPHEPKAMGDSLESLGINFGGMQEPTATPVAPDDETRILPAQERPAAPSNPTPTSNASVSPGTVNLEDIFGSQALPGEEDANSQTLPTFVSTPGAENPEESRELPKKPAAPAETPSDTQSISFEQLFGSPEASTPSAPVAPAAPATPTPTANFSIEDALAATLSDMNEGEPGEAPAEVAPTAARAEAAPAAAESLDERSERMFREQMDKARTAYNDQNWRQAVHFLSIASALHPENEEAKQMLKEARAEKRKAEESV